MSQDNKNERSFNDRKLDNKVKPSEVKPVKGNSTEAGSGASMSGHATSEVAGVQAKAAEVMTSRKENVETGSAKGGVAQFSGNTSSSGTAASSSKTKATAAAPGAGLAASSGSSSNSSKTRTANLSTSTSTTKAVDYAAYHGDPGVGRFLWWALAGLALLIGLGLIATQCFGSEDPSDAADPSSAATASATESNAAIVGMPDENVDAATSAGNEAAVPVTEIRDEAIAALKAQGFNNVAVRMDGNVANLSGSVANAAERQTAEDVVAAVTGVESVRNSIILTGSSSKLKPAETPAAEPEIAEPSYSG